MDPSRTHRAELGTNTCSIILRGQSWYPNMPSKNRQHTAWGAASRGQRKCPIAGNSIYAASFKGSYGTDLALYVHHPSFGRHSSRYHQAPTHRPTCLNAAVSIFVGDTGDTGSDPSSTLNLHGLISQAGGLAAGSSLSASAFRSALTGLDPANQMEGKEDDFPI